MYVLVFVEYCAWPNILFSDCVFKLILLRPLRFSAACMYHDN